MKLIKTIGLFCLNKILELYHNVLKSIFIMIGCFLLSTTAAFGVALAISGIGWIAIQIMYAIGFASTAHWLMFELQKPDAYLMFRGVIPGIAIIGTTAAVWFGCIIRKDAMRSITRFIKSNWELAKAGKIYTPKD